MWTDGVMDWRNHYKDQVGSVEIRTRADGTGIYYVDLLEPKYGLRFLVDSSHIDSQEIDYNSVQELYERKRKELGYEQPTK
ncbi:Uncharacterised protein [Chlamydia trachomatis]|nr:Uncharacterised protein [Chlamydia trachomatis]